LTVVLIEVGDLAAAEPVCAATLARSRDAGDLWNQVALLAMMVTLDLEAGRIPGRYGAPAGSAPARHAYRRLE